MSNVSNSVCPKHPDNAAVCRCLACFKPICHECVNYVNNETFCSPTCAENHIRSSADLARFKSKQKSGVLKKVIILAVLAALAWVAWSNQDKIKELINKQTQENKTP